jgi:3-phenylpropionate/trans-cinnamate dioxygenase ferredoxin subunit
MTMSSYIEAGRTGDFQDGTKKKVTVGGQEVMLARVGDRYYAVGNRCPHMGGDLSAGKLEGTIVTCPRHSSQFDITDGHNVRWMKGAGLAAALGKIVKSPRPVPTYNVKIDGDAILIEV